MSARGLFVPMPITSNTVSGGIDMASDNGVMAASFLWLGRHAETIALEGHQSKRPPASLKIAIFRSADS